ncbi:MAG: UbiD family decarboxylase [Candidatus Nitrosocaldaceae archaeon]
MSDIRSFIDIIKKGNELIEINKEVSTKFEVAALIKQTDKTILFNNIQDNKFRIVANLCNTRKKFGLAIDSEDIHSKILNAITNNRELLYEDIKARNIANDLSILPIVTHFEKDSGPFITSSIVFARNENKIQNASVHRMLLIDEKHLAIRMVEGRHLDRCYQYAKEHGEDLQVVITIGVHPAVLIAAAYQAAYNFNEMKIAAALTDLKVSTINDLEIPSHAEFILEGRIIKDLYHKESMVEMLRTYDHVRSQPVFEVEKIRYRDNAIYHDILAGYNEHRLLMGLPIEAKIEQAVKGIANVKKVRLTDGGCNWLHAVIQISKRLEGEPKNILLAAFAAHPSLKLAIIVDDDIDPEDPVAIEYALATRFQADEDLIIINKAKGSSLDPSSDQEHLLTSKMGIDATIPLYKRREGFEIAKIPNEDNIRIEDYVKY